VIFHSLYRQVAIIKYMLAMCNYLQSRLYAPPPTYVTWSTATHRRPPTAPIDATLGSNDA